MYLVDTQISTRKNLCLFFQHKKSSGLEWLLELNIEYSVLTDITPTRPQQYKNSKLFYPSKGGLLARSLL